jgi:hypothetical protein
MKNSQYNGFMQICTNFKTNFSTRRKRPEGREGIVWAFIDFGMDLIACKDLDQDAVVDLLYIENKMIV